MRAFQRSDLLQIDGTINAVLNNGSVFIWDKEGNQIYAPSRLVEDQDPDTGDSVRCWCLLNDPDFQHSAKYRAVRVVVTDRLDVSSAPTGGPVEASGPFAGVAAAIKSQEAPDGPPAKPAVPEAFVLNDEDLKKRVKTYMLQRRVFSAKQAYTHLCLEDPRLARDRELQQRVQSHLMSLATKGDITTVRVFSSLSQDTASHVIYSEMSAAALIAMIEELD